jgi:hypothetical protein
VESQGCFDLHFPDDRYSLFVRKTS